MKRFLAARQSSLIAAGLALGLTLWLLTGLSKDPPAAAGARTEAFARAQALTSVRVREFHARPVRQEVVVNGRTEPNRAVTLRAEAEGRVIELGAERGAAVSAGEVIVRLDMRDRKARLVEAEAAVEQRRLEYAAAQKLSAGEFLSETQRAEIRARLEAARAAVKRMRLEIAHTIIRAPFDGVLQERDVELGDFVDVGNPVARIVDTDPLIVAGEVSEQEVAEIAVGDRGRARPVTGGNLQGQVRYIAAEADEATRTFRVELQIPNPGSALRAGVTTEVTLAARALQAHHLSPALLALDDSGEVGVKAVDEAGVVRFHPVRIVRSGAAGLWVTGLPETVRLITVGQGFVRAGEKVRAVVDQAHRAAEGAEG
ncbi:MAG: efflux RND transporter periplasmic adaptor subunit [Gammaproteobacteria bacterium]|nr:efflux RND transporter periplasmic adaptor subunit [Gammaproteobacteria bacterium]NIR96816.1 efflux RND transporter periplasmic adaptor subunit [Gammaproteobacteria bacterium]NIT62516.1 efflux RND transporter periplasmic adaptor subunit [Gammaproteobacteria bacterium]NIV19456.1 efflux RND transporter periplasmic adaptor subunit [Gammaproteobacteria bacterium]NIX10539.1 efflux RND transporter periplasmic adaptor subunit [Gammaproteobacteria bacterium]